MRRVLPARSRQFALLMTLCAAVLAWRMLLVHHFTAIDLHSGSAHHPRTCHATDTRLDGLLFGCALAVWGNPVLDGTQIRRTQWLWQLLPACMLLLLASFLIRSVSFRETWRYTIQGLALMPVFVCVIRYHDTPLLRFLNWRWVSRLGVFSYSFYLTHALLLALTEEWLPDSVSLSHVQLMLLRGIVAFGLTLIASWLIHHGVERPFLRLRRRLGGVTQTVQHKQSSGLALNHA